MSSAFRLSVVSRLPLAFGLFVPLIPSIVSCTEKTTEPRGTLTIYRFPGDLPWGHVAFELADRTGPHAPLYRGLCQESHFQTRRTSLARQEEDLPTLFLHLYDGTIKPLFASERAAREAESASFPNREAVVLSLSETQYQRVLSYVRAADRAIAKGDVGYVGFDRLRTLLSDRFPGEFPVYLNCASYVEGALDAAGIPPRPTDSREFFCTWPSLVFARAEKARDAEAETLSAD